METHTAEALVLDVIDLGEYDRIVTFLTRRQGKRRGVAKGSRRKFSRFGGQLQPLAKVSVSWREKEGRDLARITAVEMVRSADALQKDLEGLLLSAYLRDHMIEFAQDNEPGDTMFRLLDSTIEALLAGIDRDLATRYFEAWVLRLAGIFPAPHRCPECDRPLLERGAVLPRESEGLVCVDCAGPSGQKVAAEVLDFLLRIGRSALAEMASEAPTPATLEKVDKLCAAVRRRFLQHELKSYEVIRETLAGLSPSHRASARRPEP